MKSLKLFVTMAVAGLLAVAVIQAGESADKAKPAEKSCCAAKKETKSGCCSADGKSCAEGEAKACCKDKAEKKSEPKK